MERVDPDRDSIKTGSSFHMKNSIREAAPGDCGAVYGLITALEGKPVDREAFKMCIRDRLYMGWQLMFLLENYLWR